MNMAFDSLFFSACVRKPGASLRFYGWEAECRTCGRFQNPGDFRGLLPSGTPLVRRPTGGGLVFHGFGDITYALVVPSGHEFFSARPRDSYAALHGKIAECMRAAGCEAELAGASETPRGPAQCFVFPSFGDIVAPGGGKFAGAAQKRTRFGFLMQGSIKFPGCGENFRAALAEAFAELLGGGIVEEPDAGFSAEALAAESVNFRAICVP